ncbi:hypothetical protein N7G274_006519 [Stereocaulon virgatum]|uniref:Nuclear pore complex component n=1 Tax=Stereocaulon virgatum TaxID=373712 RepID=A0ABR4A528_9LECA
MASTTTNPSTPQARILQASTSTPSPGSWRHPRFEEIARRQKANTFNDSNLRRVVWNGGALIALFVASSYPWYQTLNQLAQPLSTPLLLLFYLLGLYNITIAILPLLRKTDELADIPLTPTQRKLLGLDPNATPPFTPGTQYITPPRYPRSPTPRTISPANRSSGGDRGTPVSGSPSYGRDVADSPTGSPLWSKAVGSTRELGRRSSYGSPSPLGPGLGGRDGSVLGMPNTPSPTGRGASVGLNSKWLYHRGRSSSGGKGGFGGSALVGN